MDLSLDLTARKASKPKIQLQAIAASGVLPLLVRPIVDLIQRYLVFRARMKSVRLET